MPNSDIMVSICCLTFNHEMYIRKALDGFLMQKTDFNIEIIVHDDASTDGTHQIIEEYAAKHPQLFRPVFQPKNLYSSGTGIYQIYTRHVFPLAWGKYIAICEGDDYWTDPLKLQKQIDFMEQNSDFAICFHNATFKSNKPNGASEHEKFYGEILNQKTEFVINDLIRNNFIPNCTTVYRNTVKQFSPSFDDCSFPDWPLHFVYAETGRIKFLDEAMAVHYIHENGMWEGSTKETQIRTVLQFYTSLLRFAKPALHQNILESIQSHAKTRMAAEFNESFNLGYTLGSLHNNEQSQILQNDLTQIFESQSWKLANLMRRGSALVFPPGSKRRRMGKFVYQFLKKIYNGLKFLKQKIRDGLLILDKAQQKFKTIKITNPKWPDDLPLVSVIIPNFNYGKYIGETIASVLDQTFMNFEILVIDGGSSDPETISVLKKIDHPKIQVFFREDRYMVGNNRNYGIDLAKGKYICCLDADDMIEPTYLEKALYFLEAQHFDVVYPFVQSFGNSEVLWKTQTATFEILTRIGNVVAVNAVYLKEAWAKCGGYKDYPIGKGHVSEDWEFWTRLTGHGYRFKSIPEALMLYRIHSNSLLSLSETPIDNQREIIRKENLFLEAKNYQNQRKKSLSKVYSVINPFINLKQAKGRKRILLALPFMITGGVDTLFLNIFSHLAKIYDISIITSIDTLEEYGDNTPNYLKITKEIYKLNIFLTIEKQMEDFIHYLVEAKQIDLVFIAGSELTYRCLPKLKAKFAHLKVVDFLFNEIDHIKNNRKCARYIDMNIVENEKIQSFLLRKYNGKPNKIQLIHNGININQVVHNPDKNEIRAKNGLADRKFLVAYMGRFSVEKNPQAVVEIAKLLSLDGVEFFMGGNGPLYNEIVDLIRQNGLERTIKTPGFIDTGEILHIADVLILPSTFDGRPNIVLEALAAGVPVIASDVGGLPGLIIDGDNGFLLKSDDHQGFADKISLLKNDKELLKTMKQSARKYAIENLDDKIMRGKYAALLNQLMEKD